ncbi:MAG TPA: gliding motility-associated C-terminal domain-containing protein, partial [Chitinophagaceae bacterium]
GGNSYQWIPAAGLNNANIADPKASPTATTTYKVLVTNSSGCKDSAYVTVTVNPLPVINLSPNASICPSDSAQLSASGGATYQWFPATGLSSTSIANPKASPITTTTYQAIVTTAGGCKDSSSTTVSVLTKPVATASNDITICSGDTVMLSASGGTNYQWIPTTGISNPNQPNTNAYPNTTTGYSAIVTNADGCKDTAYTLVTVTAKPGLDLGPDNEICNGDNISFDATTQGASSYLWNNGSTDAVITVSQTGSYSVQVGIPGCLNPVKDTITLSVLSLPTVNLGPDTSTCNFQPLILTAEGTDISTYLWSTGATDSFIAVNTAGTYQVLVSNACGTASDDAIIAIEVCSDDIYFPSAFTPNYDGRNDLFKAAYMNGVSVTDYNLKVFNRWGQLVFKTDDYTKGWDGIFKGKMQQTEVFVWIAEYKKSTSGELIRKKGTVTLLR